MASLDGIISRLLNPEQPVSARMRSIFGLKAIATPPAVRALERSLLTDKSALVRHEVAYVLGQMGTKDALPTLVKVLEDASENSMVRHEAAEAMGAIADDSVLPLLEKYAADKTVAREIWETCVLAVESIRWRRYGGRTSSSTYASVDPAPPSERLTLSQLRDTLCNESTPMFERYRAMFALRNMGGRDAVLALCDGMEAEKESALFRHEVAYVLGQMQHEASVPTLTKFLKCAAEHEMVRHEAAEALGSVGTKEAEIALEEFKKDHHDVVRESVEVALDISDYVSGDNLHYAETLERP